MPLVVHIGVHNPVEHIQILIREYHFLDEEVTE